MKCIIGLGNIGKEYENTRHNIGFLFLDYLSKKYDVKFDKKKTKCIYGETYIEGKKVSFIKPTTFMNLSGETISQMLNWYKIDVNDICVVYDDIDIPFGEVRFREKGSAGTHNGMKNIVQILKTEEINRIRIGIENRKEVNILLTDYVLTKFNKEEMSKLSNIFERAEQNVLNFLTNE